MLKILILGTSNSILKDGWTTGLRMGSPDAEITNRSIGGSPGMQFGWMMKHDFTIYDLVVFDSVPNDEKLSIAIGSIDYSSRITFEIVSTISAQTRVLVLGFCLDKFLEEPSEIYLRRASIAQRCGAQFVSMRDVTTAFGRAILGSPAIPLFEAEAHPDRSIAKLAGFTLAHLLPGFVASTPKASPSRDFSDNFSCLDPTERSDVQVVECKNSLLSGRFVELHAGEAIEVDLPGVCIGFYLNRYGSRASLNLEARNNTKIRDCWQDITPDLLEMRFEPIADGFAFDRLSVSHRWREGGAVIRNRKLDYSVPAPQAQIGKLVFWSGRVGDGLPAAANEAFDHLSLHNQLMAALEESYQRIDGASEADVPPHEMLKTGRLAAVAKTFDRMANSDPTNVALLGEAAIACLRAGRFDLAEIRLRQRLELRPEDPSAYNDLADVLVRLRQLDEARSLLRRSLSIAPLQPVTHYRLGRLLYDGKDLTGALEHLLSAEYQGADIVDLQLLIGQVKSGLRDWGGAIAALSRFVRTSPQNFKGVFLLGRAYGAARQFDEAIDALNRAITLQPDNTLAIRDLAQVHAARGEHHAVITLLHDILKTDKADCSFYRVYGRAALALKLRPIAMDAFQRALELQPADVVSRNGMQAALALTLTIPSGRAKDLSAA